MSDTEAQEINPDDYKCSGKISNLSSRRAGREFRSGAFIVAGPTFGILYDAQLVARERIADFIKKPYAVLFSLNKKDAQFAALEQRLEETRKIDDVAERIVAAEKLYKDASEAGLDRDLDTHPLRFVPSLVPLALIGAAIAAPFVATPVATLLVGGAAIGFLASMVTGFAATIATGKMDQSLKTAQQVRKETSALIHDAPQSGNFLSIAQSPHFDGLMAKYPALKDSFLLASAREKPVQDLSAAAAIAAQAAEAGQEKNGKPSSNGFNL